MRAPTEAEQRVLHNMKVVARQVLPCYVANNLEANIYSDYPCDALVYELRSVVLAENIGSREYEVSFARPASWWQHFKRDTWLGRKIAKRRPVRLTIETKVVHGLGYRGYPHAPIALPEDKMGKAVVFEMFEGPLS